MRTKAYLAVSALIFTLVSVMQLVRLIQGWVVQVGPYTIPTAASWFAVAVAAAMAIWGFSRLKAA